VNFPYDRPIDFDLIEDVAAAIVARRGGGGGGTGR